MTTDDLQLDLELNSIRWGFDRDYNQSERLRKREEYGGQPSSSDVIRACLPDVAFRVKDLLDAGKGPHINAIALIDPEVTSYLTLWCVFNSVGRNDDVRRATLSLGEAVEDHLWTDALRELDEDAFEKVFKRVTKGSRRPGARKAKLKKAFRDQAEELEERFEHWTPSLRMRVGAVLLNAALVENIAVVRKDDEGVDHVEFSSHVLAALADLDAEASWVTPVKLPMLTAPKPWRGWDDGGYTTRVMQQKNTLVRSSSTKVRDAVTEAINSGAMQSCLAALNMVQATPWRINKSMLDVVTELHTTGIDVEGLPRAKTIPVIAYPDDFEKLAPDEQRRLKKQRADIRRRNATIQGQLVTFRGDMRVARDFARHARFWLPHNLDFRGRVYPIPTFNQQRSDYVKAMLDFADGVELTDEGYKWLCIHAANCGDFDKISKRPFFDRLKWVKHNMDMIRACGSDPMSNMTWLQADKPFEFLRACMDVAAYVDAKLAGRVFLSHLPVQIDGSNSGLQHYSAMMRSQVDGAYVNLVPTETPADVYAVVAQRVTEIAKADGGDLARIWLEYGITRKIVKRNVMTFPYSSEAYGFREQIMEDLMVPLSDDVIDGKLPAHPFGTDGGWAAAGWIAKATYAAVIDTVQSASAAMKWFKKVAGALAHEGHGLKYSTPVGLPVIHQYNEWEAKRVSLWLYDRAMPVIDAGSRDTITQDGVYRRIMSNVRVRPTTVINKSKQKSAVSPNIVHSLDGAHLMLTVNEATKRGVPCFSLIHDSFGCHASHMPLLYDAVRSTMVEMYDNYDVIEEIASKSNAVLCEKGQKKIADKPVKGTLNLADIQNSKYAFA